MAGDQSKKIERIATGIHTTCAFCIGFVLLYSSTVHLSNPYAFLSKVYSYEIVTERIGVVLASLLPSFELSVGILLLFFSKFRRTGFILAAILFCLFSLVQFHAWLRGLNISCGCFSNDDENPINWFTIGRTLLFFTLAVMGLLTGFNKKTSLTSNLPTF